MWAPVFWPRPVAHAVLLVLGALYGITDEWHQMYVPGRMPDVADWLGVPVAELS